MTMNVSDFVWHQVRSNDREDFSGGHWGMAQGPPPVEWVTVHNKPIPHALRRMQTSLDTIGARDVFRQGNDTNHHAGTLRMATTRTPAS